MKNIFVIFILIALIGCSKNKEEPYFNNNNANDYINFYSYKENWYGNRGNNDIFLGGEIIVQIKILDMFDNKINFEIYKEMTGFGQIILNKATAEKKDEKYEFNFTDGWGNKAFGNIILNNDETITFYLDCEEFSDSGKDIGRLYGDTHILRKEMR